METGEVQRVGVLQRLPLLVVNFVAGGLVLLFALAGFFTGGIAGALASKASDSGVVRGAGLGAVAGAILSLKILDASRELLHLGQPGSRRSSLMAEITEELICWRFEEENILPSEMLAPSHWQNQQVNFTNHRVDEIREGVVQTRGLSRDSLKKFPHREIIADTKPVQLSCCTICLQDLEVGETARTLPRCQHTFHLACINKWLVRHGSCPLCRQDV